MTHELSMNSDPAALWSEIERLRMAMDHMTVTIANDWDSHDADLDRAYEEGYQRGYYDGENNGRHVYER